MHPLFGGPEKTVSLLVFFMLAVVMSLFRSTTAYHDIIIVYFRLLRVYMGPVLTTEGQLSMKTYGRPVMMSRYIAASLYPSVMI